MIDLAQMFLSSEVKAQLVSFFLFISYYLVSKLFKLDNITSLLSSRIKSLV